MDFESASADMIFCNPPFHQQNAWAIRLPTACLSSRGESCAKAGELWVIGNRHLPYHLNLDRLFARHSVVRSQREVCYLEGSRE